MTYRREFWLIVGTCWALAMLLALQEHSVVGLIVTGLLTAHCFIRRALIKKNRRR